MSDRKSYQPPKVVDLGRCRHGIAWCRCIVERGNRHGPLPKPCPDCGGETGFHRGLCLRGIAEGPLVVGYDIPEPS